MLTERMKTVAVSIEHTIQREFPSAYQKYLFSDDIEIKDVVNQVLFECCKYAYDQTAEKKSLRYFLKKENMSDDDQRMVLQRSIYKINSYRQKEYELYKTGAGIELPELLKPQMDSIDQKLAGYRFNDLQFWEINNVHDMWLVDAIVSGKVSKKNFKKSTFIQYADNYDDNVRSLKHTFENDSKPDDKVFASLAYFILEWKYAFDFYYEIASEMESAKIDAIPDEEHRCCLFCGPVALDSVLNVIAPYLGGSIIQTESRMITVRKKYVKPFVHIQDTEKFDALQQKYSELLFMVSSLLLHMTFQGKNVREWFVANSTLDDWASVMDEYDVFTAFMSDKSWTSKKIRYVKEIYGEIYEANSKVTENPENRS